MKLTSFVIASAFAAHVESLRFGDFQHAFVAGHEGVNNAKPLTTAFSFIMSLLGLPLKDAYSNPFGVWDELAKEFPIALSELATETALKSAEDPARPLKKIQSNNWIHTVSTEALPNHILRVKSPESLQVDNVKQFSGYLDVGEEKHLFFWSFESRNDPKNDPVVLWLNGGPGCSSLTGLFFELGPASIDSNLKPIHNPYAWNNNATVIFLDQPADTGYSYSNGDSVTTTVTAAKDSHAFLTLFFKQFPDYAKRDFHIAGESYAGHYIPVLASEILSHEDNNFNLTSVVIGNGMVDPLRQYDFYEPMACGGGGSPAVLTEDVCENLRDSQARCNSLIKSCYENESTLACIPANIYCNNAMWQPYRDTGKNVYDLRVNCTGSSLCYDDLDYVEDYLNQEFVKKVLGADVETYKGCNWDVNKNFVQGGDFMQPYYKTVVDILEKGLPVLIYAGDKDYICNWLGNENWVRKLEWSGSKGIAEAKVEPWIVDSQEAGTKFNHEKFTFLRVYNAGHMVPYNQPENSLSMINDWLSGDFAFSTTG